ncbi:alpha/beta hydrolase [Pseudomonas sp. LJDD11]|uniref:alpha/beta fold hydrolase n=1 Tax=unclassified Pseudomonas TaxID=196821 RepID=UPI002097D17E|nr:MULTISPECIES: alpha/beta hydrolase [unclassified Pseudomonas]MCO8165959.1 alpha/beta hydrolase [Pseudomonas sp. 21LCFQ010]MCQ9425174.1 alpha/beta hydrolase [Pseudomonas sp. LJDD11]
MQQLAATKGKNIQVNGTTLWVADTGEAELPVVLCLHSCFLDGTMFDGLVQAAAGKFRVVRPDFRGQGKSALHDVDIITMDECADDMLALIEAMQLKDINVMAQSMGGDVAFRLIAQRQALFRSLVVAGSSACGEPPEQGARFAQWVVDAGEQGFTGEILDMTMEVMFGKTTRNNPDKQALMAYWRERIAALPKTLRPAMKGVMHRETSVPLLPSIRIPVLIINGEEDMPRPPAWSDEMKRELPNAKLMRLSKIGHSPTLEAPEQVLPAIIAFYSNPSV